MISHKFPTTIKLGRVIARNLSSIPRLQISDEVKQAVLERKPVVALESTIITHGLPYPANIEMASQVQNLVRKANAIPATVGFVKGIPTVGLSDEELQYMADPDQPRFKVSRRDIPYMMANHLTGGTTIAGTMILANAAGIDVFASGGLGGVSRPSSLMDVSADLDELGKTPVSVVCSGPKSILDVGTTMEYLETKGVPVFTFNDGDFPPNQRSLDVPGFYTRDSGIPSPYVFDSAKEAASVIYNGKYTMKLSNGYVFCIPAPVSIALPSAYISRVIDRALGEAQHLHIRGKALTPFLLERINQLTNGASVKCNIAFVKHNAVMASAIAAEVCSLKESHSTVEPIVKQNTARVPIRNTSLQSSNIKSSPNDVAIIGSLSLDSTSIIKSTNNLVMGDSNPGRTFHFAGGVGFNVALSCATSGSSPLFISALNKSDVAGSSLLKLISTLGVSSDGLCNLPNGRTCQYTSIHDGEGRLIVACSDMGIIEELTAERVVQLLAKDKPRYVLTDANVSVDLLNAIQNYALTNSAKVIYEPTSAVKAAKLGQVDLHCFPNNTVQLITPTVAELNTLFQSFERHGKFEDLDHWFPVLDSLKVDKLRLQLENCSNRYPYLKRYSEEGIFQQAFRMLPYVPNILLKDGANGLFVIQLTDDAEACEGQVDTMRYNLKTKTQAVFTLVQRGSHNLGVVIQHFPAYKIPDSKVKSVTGAGDSMIGYIMAQLGKGKNIDILTDLSNPEREKLLMSAQKVACLSLLSDHAVNVSGIKDLIHSSA